MLWHWNLGETFQFFVQKLPGKAGDTTDARYYVFDRTRRRWLHSATINSPNGGKKSVATIGGGLNSFLENFAGKDKAIPKLALYRLWLGSSVDKMKCLTRAQGDGTWGQLHDAYFLAEGDPAALEDVFAKLEEEIWSTHDGGKRQETRTDLRHSPGQEADCGLEEGVANQGDQEQIGIAVMFRRIALSLLVFVIAAPALAADQKAKTTNDQDDPIGRKLSERLGPYLGMVDITNQETSPLRNEKHEDRLDRDLTEVRNEMLALWKKKYQGLTLDEKIHYCIFQLRNDSRLGMGLFWNDEPYSTKPEATVSQELVKFGRAVDGAGSDRDYTLCITQCISLGSDPDAPPPTARQVKRGVCRFQP